MNEWAERRAEGTDGKHGETEHSWQLIQSLQIL